jgi:signal transduction histidine kinase
MHQVGKRRGSIKLMRDQEIIYVSPNFEVLRITLGNDIEKYQNAKQMIFSNEKGSEIYYSSTRENHLISLHIFSNNPVVPEISRKDLDEEAELYKTMLICVFLLTMFIIAVTNGILTTFISRSNPYAARDLHEGTNQIKQGNLDHAVVYNKQDEFGTVCSDFEEMRRRLKESVLEQQKYEESRKELIAGISHDLGTPLTLKKAMFREFWTGSQYAGKNTDLSEDDQQYGRQYAQDGR